MDQHIKPSLLPFHTEAARFAAGTSTPRALLEACIERIEALEPRIGAFVQFNLSRARAEADAATRRWQARAPLSPIDGMPVGVKDIIETDDMPTEMGSPLWLGHRARFDAASVAGLRDAGAVVVGKTVTTEFAATVPGGTRNPWDLRRTPGGSSSGSAAAVGVGMLPAALGTQVVGSILRPAGFCGAVGFKPGVGAINRGGSLDFLSQSATGVIAASLQDAWLTAHEIARRVGGDPGHKALAGPEGPPVAIRPQALGLVQTAGWDRATPAAKQELDRAVHALRGAGIAVHTRRDNAEIEALEQALAEAEPLTRLINAWEWRWPMMAFAARDPAGLSAASRERFEWQKTLTVEQYDRAVARRAEIRAQHARLRGSVDALVTLTAPGAAPIGLGWTGDPMFVVPGSFLGVPAITQPLLRDEGMPLGLQLLGWHGADAELFGIAAWVRDTMGAA